MPIGKNALKRVSNNGYSKVSVSAPDMEHSEIIDIKEEKAPKTAEPKKAASSPKNTAKKTESKKPEKPLGTPEVKIADAKAAPKKNNAPKAKKPALEKPAIKELESSHPDGFVRYGLGEDLPEHLL